MPVADAPLLLRLHTGNFSDFFYLKEDASDLRFVAADDKTPLAYHIEKFDLVNQMLYVWVKLPNVAAADGVNSIYMYYGNAEAQGTVDAATAYEPQRIAAFHFAEQNNVVVDSSSYQQKAELVNVEHAASLIGQGLKFTGNGVVKITHAPTLQYLPGKGFAFRLDLTRSGTRRIVLRSVDATRERPTGHFARSQYPSQPDPRPRSLSPALRRLASLRGYCPP